MNEPIWPDDGSENVYSYSPRQVRDAAQQRDMEELEEKWKRDPIAEARGLVTGLVIASVMWGLGIWLLL